MSFNDFLTPNTQEFEIMKQSYDRILERETNDLKEIHNKMIEQRANLIGHNIDSRYDSIIDKLSSNIAELDSIISTNNSNILYKSPILPQISKPHSLISRLQNDSTAISPIRSHNEIMRYNNLQVSTHNLMF